MNRVLAVAVTAATATVVVGAAIVPATAAQRPANARTAATATAKKSGAKTAESRAKLAAQRAAASASAPLQIASQLDNGQYVTVVQCHGSVKTPPPIQVGRPDAPLSVKGGGQSSGLLAMLKRPNAYKTVYTCTVVVKERAQPKPKPRAAGHRTCVVVSGAGSGSGKGGNHCKKVTLNTGFGGMASKVAQHHPAG